MKRLSYFCCRNTSLVKINLVILLGIFLFPIMLLAQAGTDSIIKRPDTGLTRKSFPDANTGADIINYRDTFTAGTTDSLNKLGDSVIRIPPAISGRNKLFLFQQVLFNHPYFNFLASPLSLVIQEKKGGGSELFFYVLLILFFYYALIRLVFVKYMDDLFTLFFRSTLRQQQLREQLLQSPLPSLLLNILFVFSGSLYASFLFRHFNVMMGTDFWILWLYSLLVLIVVYLGKFLIMKTFGWILRISRVTDVYLFVVFMVNKMAGIFLLPVLLLIAFPEPQLLPVVITLSLFVLALLLGYRFLVSYRLIRNEIKLNVFHFFLYLCAFEIAPLLLVFKVLLEFVTRTV